nr:endonuclease/exonuclease/phosphatase family protein [uncultured Actinotalea sp.]
MTSDDGAPRTPGPLPGPAHALLVAVLAFVTLELVRSSGPLLDTAFAVGVVEAAGTALLTYALPGALLAVLALAARRSGSRTLVLGALVLAALRLALPQLTGAPRVVVGLAAVALAVGVLVAAVAATAGLRGGPLALRTVLLGLALHVGAQLLLTTWDAVWRTDPAGWAVTLLVVAALVVAALRVRREAAGLTPHAAPLPPVRRLGAVGLLLALTAMALANVAWVTSQSGLPLAVAGPVTGAGLLVAAWLIGLESAPRVGWSRSALRYDAARPVVDAVVLAVLTLALLQLTGPLLLVVLVAVQVLAAQQAALALRVGPGPGALHRTALTATAAGLATILPLLLFQLEYDVPLPFPHTLVVGAAAALLGAAGVHRRGEPDRREVPRRPGLPTVVGVGVLVAGTAQVALATVGSTPADDDPRAGGEQVTVVSWNLHYGVTPAGHVRLEELARTVQEQDACVVLLQEVARGWVLAGGTDMATWLGHRLDMQVSFARAADRQFGNAVLSCVPQRDVVVHALPYGAGPQERSAISATVDVGGVPQRYTSVHLQHRERNTPTRLEQLERLLTAGDLGVLGGDLNAEPGWPELDLLEDAGFVSAQDALGDPSLLTSPTPEPRYRIDWVLGPGWAEGDRLDVLPATPWSDHAPLVLRHAPRGD